MKLLATIRITDEYAILKADATCVDDDGSASLDAKAFAEDVENVLFLVRHKREELRCTRIPLKLGEEPERVVVELSKDVLNI